MYDVGGAVGVSALSHIVHSFILGIVLVNRGEWCVLLRHLPRHKGNLTFLVFDCLAACMGALLR